MVKATKKRRFVNYDDTSPLSWAPSSSSSSASSSVEAAIPPKKLKVSTRRTTRSLKTSKLANKRPLLSISEGTFTAPDWLPDGWTAVVLAKANGQKYKVYKETATGKKFYSKPQVLNHLGIADNSNSNKKKVKFAPPKEQQVSTLPTTPSEIPKPLYDLIQNAARARKSLKRNINNRFSKRKLEYYENRIRCVAAYFKHITEELSSDWRYDPETSFMAHVPMLSTPPKPKTKERKKKTEKKKKKIKITWSSPNYHGSYPLNDAEKNIWSNFKKNDTAEAKTDKHVRVEKHLHMVDKDDKVVDLLGEFAVDTFNRSCQMYLNKDEDFQVSGAEFIECKFYKLTWKYIFYMTIEAIEQGILGVYETRVECDAKDGAKTLMYFMLTDREPKWNRPWVKPRLEPRAEYETVQDGSSDPRDFYELTGMVHRETEGGGFDYHNPPFSTHRINFTSTKDEGAMAFVPNVTIPLATKSIQMDVDLA